MSVEDVFLHKEEILQTHMNHIYYIYINYIYDNFTVKAIEIINTIGDLYQNGTYLNILSQI